MTKNEREKTKNAMRNNAILNSYFSSFRLASFRYFRLTVAYRTPTAPILGPPLSPFEVLAPLEWSIGTLCKK